MASDMAVGWRANDRVGGNPRRRRGIEQALKRYWAEEVFNETLPSSRSFMKKRRRDILAN